MRVSDLPESTRQEMAEFFLRTSVPRILAERKRKKEQNHYDRNCDDKKEVS